MPVQVLQKELTCWLCAAPGRTVSVTEGLWWGMSVSEQLRLCDRCGVAWVALTEVQHGLSRQDAARVAESYAAVHETVLADHGAMHWPSPG